MNEWLLLPAGFIAGLIDSIAGGGGLITVPSLALVLGPGAEAIGTNKVAAVAGVLVSFGIYYRGGHFKARSGIPFAIVVGLCSFVGSLITPHIPRSIFPWLILVTCPLVLFTVWKKDFWLKEHPPGSKRFRRRWIFLAGALVGLYDGLWGPGGGTFMFLSLVFLVRLPILESLAASKFANLSSGAMALTGYAAQGYVHWAQGGILAMGMIVGSYIGASFASRNALKVVRPALVVVVLLLLTKVFGEFLN